MPEFKNKGEIIIFIQKCIKDKRYLITKHGREKASFRGINTEDIESALLAGEVIEDYPKDKRGHSSLVYGKTKSGKILHLVCAISTPMLGIVTVYRPSKNKWINYKIRRRKK